MTDTATMVQQTGITPSAELVAAIDALYDCAKASTACATAMIGLGGMAAEVRLALDCADISSATARVLARGTGDPTELGAVIESAAVVCDASAAACGKHADHHVHCRLHAASARACAEALRALQASG